MVTRRDIKLALAVGLPLALVTTLLFRFGPIFSEPLLVPNMPLERYLALSPQEQDVFIQQASPESFRPVVGLEKVYYLLRARPGLYLAYWLILAVPICGAIVFGAWAARRQQPNTTPHADARDVPASAGAAGARAGGRER
jgi:hypothetical protein